MATVRVHSNGAEVFTLRFGGDGGDTVAAGIAVSIAEITAERDRWLAAGDGGSPASCTAAFVPRGSAVSVVFHGELPEVIRDEAVVFDRELFNKLPSISVVDE